MTSEGNDPAAGAPTVRYWRRLPILPPSMDGNPVPFLQPMVGAFGLVCTLNE